MVGEHLAQGCLGLATLSGFVAISPNSSVRCRCRSPAALDADARAGLRARLTNFVEEACYKTGRLRSPRACLNSCNHVACWEVKAEECRTKADAYRFDQNYFA